MADKVKELDLLDPNRPETEADGIRTAKLRRLLARRLLKGAVPISTSSELPNGMPLRSEYPFPVNRDM